MRHASGIAGQLFWRCNVGVLRAGTRYKDEKAEAKPLLGQHEVRLQALGVACLQV